MGTVRLGDRVLDCGGKNIGRRYTLFRQFAAEHGSHPLEYFGLNSSQAVDGKVRTFDGNARWRTLAQMARGIAPTDLLRFGRLLYRVKCDDGTGYLGSSYGRRLAERFDELPASQYFSPEFCRRILRPMSVRMNGAEPDEVYVGNLTSNVRMLLDTYEQFTNGLAPLLDACLTRYDVRLNTATESVIVENGCAVGVRVRHHAGALEELRGAGVIVATPASVAARLVEEPVPALARCLRSVAYYPVTLMIAEYDRPIFSSRQRAFVFDGDDALSNAGAYGVNDLHLVRYTFSGRASRRYVDKGIDADTLLDIGESALGRYVPVDRRRRRQYVAKCFSPGLCAYTPHHGAFLDRIERNRVPGLFLTGDYMQGASIEACFRAARSCARQLANLFPSLQ
jgi:oxygen-dependent protoporphyrinogen oxidase